MATLSRWCAVLVSAWMLGLAGAHAQAPVSPTPDTPQASEDESNADLSDADRKKKASEHFERGVMLFGDGAYRAALIEFERAYATQPDYRLLYNLAHVRMLLEDYLGATRDYEHYLKDGGDKVPKERVDAVHRELSILKERVASIVIKANRNGAKLFVDEGNVGLTPLSEPLLVNVGRHRIYAEASDGASATKIVDVAAGEQLAVELELRAAPVSVVKVNDKALDLGHWPLTMTITTGVLAIGTLTVGLMQRNAETELEDLASKIPANKKAIEEQRTKTKRLAYATDAVMGVTVLAAAGAITLWILDSKRDEEPAPTKASAWRPQIGLGSLGVEHSF